MGEVGGGGDGGGRGVASVKNNYKKFSKHQKVVHSSEYIVKIKHHIYNHVKVQCLKKHQNCL